MGEEAEGESDEDEASPAAATSARGTVLGSDAELREPNSISCQGYAQRERRWPTTAATTTTVAAVATTE